MSLIKIPTLGIEDDAVDNTKLDLSSNYAFTGTISGAGKILQTKQVSVGTWAGTANWNSTSTSFVDSGLDITITPTSSSSTIIGNGFITYGCDVSSTNNPRWDFKIFRGGGSGTNVTQGGSGVGRYYRSNFHAGQLDRWDMYYMSPIGIVDSSHSTTSQITYELYVSSNGSQNRGGMVSLNLYEV